MTLDMVLNLVRPNIKNLIPYRSARDEFEGTADIFLDANESPYENGYNRYPDPYQRALKAKLATIKDVPVETLFLGNGSDEIIDLTFRIFCQPGIDSVIICSPTYGMYQVSADMNDIRVLDVPLSTDFQPDVATILESANETTKLLFLCSPNNPTGNLMDPKLVVSLIENFKGMVILDEAYLDFSGSDGFRKMVIRHPNLLVMQTLSKAWGLAGLRLGILFAHPSIIPLYNKSKPPYNINSATQNLAIEALSAHQSIARQIEELNSEKNRMILRIGQLAMVKQILPSHANFLLIRLEKPREVFEYLLRQGVVVRDRIRQTGDGLRITIGLPHENDRLIQILEELQS